MACGYGTIDFTYLQLEFQDLYRTCGPFFAALYFTNKEHSHPRNTHLKAIFEERLDPE